MEVTRAVFQQFSSVSKSRCPSKVESMFVTSDVSKHSIAVLQLFGLLVHARKSESVTLKTILLHWGGGQPSGKVLGIELGIWEGVADGC